MAGIHIIADLHGCSYENLNDKQALLTILINAAELAGGKIISYDSHQFFPHGITAFVLISESHLSIHTYPEYNTAFVDVFTCGEKTKPGKALSYIRNKLKPQTIRIKRITRKLRGSSNGKQTNKKGA